MAKGDSSRAQNQINYQGGLAQNSLNNQMNRTQDLYGGMYNNWQNATGNNLANYDEIMNNYRNFQNQASQFNLNPADRANVQGAMSRYQNFADTGGFTPQNIQDIRARAIAPTRAAYQQGINQVNRSQALSGASNAPAAIARMSREQAQGASDASVNANASIAQAIQQGKLAGTQGLAATSLAEQNAQLMADQIRNQLGLAGNQGMSSLYGTTPGLASMFGNQVLNANSQANQLQGLQNQIAQMIMQGQLGKSQIPGDFQQAMGNIGSGLGLVGNVVGGLTGMGGFLGGLGSAGRTMQQFSPDQMNWWGSGNVGPVG